MHIIMEGKNTIQKYNEMLKTVLFDNQITSVCSVYYFIPGHDGGHSKTACVLLTFIGTELIDPEFSFCTKDAKFMSILPV